LGKLHEPPPLGSNPLFYIILMAFFAMLGDGPPEAVV